MEPVRSDALALIETWVSNPNLRKHLFAVEAAMRAYAELYGEKADLWSQAGLLHDFDYEKFPDLRDHPFRGIEELSRLKYPKALIEIILAHAPHTGVARDTLAKKCIFAVDELCGFLVAVALVRPSKKLADVTVESVLKKMKEKGFARQVNREEIAQGAAELGIPLEKHIATVLAALQGIAPQLGL